MSTQKKTKTQRQSELAVKVFNALAEEGIDLPLGYNSFSPLSRDNYVKELSRALSCLPLKKQPSQEEFGTMTSEAEWKEFRAHFVYLRDKLVREKELEREREMEDLFQKVREQEE